VDTALVVLSQVSARIVDSKPISSVGIVTEHLELVPYVLESHEPFHLGLLNPSAVVAVPDFEIFAALTAAFLAVCQVDVS
jgi:hypothetical protein